MEMNKADVHYKLIDVTKTSITIPQDVSSKSTKEYTDELTEKHLPYLLPYPPILFSSDDTSFELVGRHWSYEMQIRNHMTNILFCVYRNKTKLDYFRNKIEKRDNAIVESVLAILLRMTSKSTKYRHKAMQTNRRCCYCHDALMSEIGSPKPDAKGFVRVHCYNSKQGRCGFFLLITEPERGKFRSYAFDINNHLKPVPDKACPKCGMPLYLRIMLMPDGVATYYECCKNKFNSITPCSHVIRLDGAPSWLTK